MENERSKEIEINTEYNNHLKSIKKDKRKTEGNTEEKYTQTEYGDWISERKKRLAFKRKISLRWQRHIRFALGAFEVQAIQHLLKINKHFYSLLASALKENERRRKRKQRTNEPKYVKRIKLEREANTCRNCCILIWTFDFYRINPVPSSP